MACPTTTTTTIMLLLLLLCVHACVTYHLLVVCGRASHDTLMRVWLTTCWSCVGGHHMMRSCLCDLPPVGRVWEGITWCVHACVTYHAPVGRVWEGITWCGRAWVTYHLSVVGGKASHDAVGVNCKMGATTEQQSQVARTVAKGWMLGNFKHIIWLLPDMTINTSFMEGGSCVILYIYIPQNMFLQTKIL